MFSFRKNIWFTEVGGWSTFLIPVGDWHRDMRISFTLSTTLINFVIPNLYFTNHKAVTYVSFLINIHPLSPFFMFDEFI